MRALPILLLLVASPGLAAPLYLLGNRGPNFSINVVDQQTGAAAVAVPLPTGSWQGLGHRPGDDSAVYALRSPVTTTEGPTTINRIDLTTGVITQIASIDPAALGVETAVFLALAIDPSMPSRAVATMSNTLEGDQFPGLVSVDLDTGLLTSSLIRVDVSGGHINSLTWSLDGSTLFGASSSITNIATFGVLDPATGSFDDTPVPEINFIEGLAIRPTDGALFAVFGSSTDSLVLLDPEDGSLLETIGPVGFGGPKDIAFVPEPSPVLLVLCGLLALRMGRGRSSPRARA